MVHASEYERGGETWKLEVGEVKSGTAHYYVIVTVPLHEIKDPF